MIDGYEALYEEMCAQHTGVHQPTPMWPALAASRSAQRSARAL